MNVKTVVLSAAVAIASLVATPFTQAAQASTGRYFSPAPQPSIPSQTGSSFYVTSAVDGTDYYGGNYFVSAVTRDNNLFVTSLAMTANTDGSMSGMYMQINCGEFYYRPLTPWVTYEPDQQRTLVEYRRNYEWRYFTPGSAMESVGREFCEIAAQDRGFRWLWVSN